MDVRRSGSIPDGSVTRAKIAAATLKHIRATTGSVAGSATVVITASWPTPFPNANYTVSAIVDESSTGVNTLEVLKIVSQTAGNVGVVVRNNDAVIAKTGTIHAIGVGD